MECNIAVIVGQIVECSNGKIVIRAPVKDGKDWLQDFQLKSNSALIALNTFPSCSRATFRKDYVCQHSDFNTLRKGSFKLFKRPFPGFLNNFNALNA